MSRCHQGEESARLMLLGDGAGHSIALPSVARWASLLAHAWALDWIMKKIWSRRAREGEVIAWEGVAG